MDSRERDLSSPTPMPPTPVVAANPFPPKPMNYYKARFVGGYKHLKDWSLLEIAGQDAQRFLQGQLTSDVAALTKNSTQLSVRIDRAGRIVAYFYLIQKETSYWCLVPNQLKHILKNDLEKYIIMDDVTIVPLEHQTTVFWSPIPPSNGNDGLCRASFGGEPGHFIWNEKAPEGEEIDEEEFWQVSLLNGYPAPSFDSPTGHLLNETLLNLHGISYNKGCFLGQESVAKTESRRGASRFPVILTSDAEFLPEDRLSSGGEKAGTVLCRFKLDKKFVIVASVRRPFRVEGKLYHFDQGHGKVTSFPFFKESKAHQLYAAAISEFQADREEKALELLWQLIQMEPSFAEAYESMGAILGRMGRYREGLELMDKVLALEPQSVMAHTNKSLFLMKLGRIEEAEEEKALATVKTFERHGREAVSKREEDKRKQAEREEGLGREKMFREVLEIDPNDSMALYGLADIAFIQGQFLQAINFLDHLLAKNEGYSMAYTLLGKCYLSLNQTDKARTFFERGIKVAVSRGELKPANQMQELLNTLPPATAQLHTLK